MNAVTERRLSDQEAGHSEIPSRGASVGGLQALLGDYDWGTTSLGEFAGWPPFIKGMIATMMSSPPAMFMAWGPDLRFFFNDAYRALMGNGLADAMGRPFAEVWSEIWPDIEPIVAKALSGTGSRFDCLPLVVTRNGIPEETWWSFSYMALRDEDTDVCGMYCVVEEATHQVRIQAALQQRDRQRAFLLELSTALLEARDPQVLLRISCGRLAQHLEGDAVAYSSVVEDVELSSVRQYARPGGAGAAVEALPALSLGPSLIARLRSCDVITVMDTEYLGQAFPGSDAKAFILVPVVDRGVLTACAAVLSARPRTWSDGEVMLVSEFANRVEVALSRMRSEEALRQAQKMDAIGQLTSGIAHDFNNLLNLISGSLELAQHDGCDDPNGYLAEARNACDRAAGLTHRLLAFSRRQVPGLVPTSPGPVVEGMESLVARTIGLGITVKTIADGNAWQTLSDPNQLENALLNLCINARDAMPEGGSLTIETRNVVLEQGDAESRNMSPGEYVSLSVTDTGSGMSAAVVAHAFEAFFTTKPEGAGTGLGLSMVHGFAKQCGGQVWIHSQPDRGTTVTIYMPRLAAPTANIELQQVTSPTLQHAGGTFLIVDDEPGIRRLLSKALTSMGYTAIAASNGFEALDLLEAATHIDLLITDVGMSGMDGQELAVAAQNKRPDLQVLFITGYSERAFLPEIANLPGLHVLTKPFAMKALADKVKVIMRR